MSVKIRPYRGGPSWEADITVRLPDGRKYRERRRITVTGKSAATRWAEARERELLINGPPTPTKEVPTLEQFGPRFINDHARANQQKPSSIAHKETVLRVHLLPALGQKRLDAIRNHDVQQLKRRLSGKKPKTVNNVLTVLNTLLKKAVEWEVIDRMPCTIRLLKVSQGSIKFFDFDAYEQLVAGAKQVGTQELVIVLLLGEAGLRVGEVPALRWEHVNLERRQLCVEQNDWQGHVGTTKGNRLRYVPLTPRVVEALRAHRHLRSPRVVMREDNTPMTYSAMVEALHRAEKAAGLPLWSPHKLKHTFCSHLAMLGAAPLALKDAAAHKNLATTMRYLHLSPGATESAVRLLEQRAATPPRGDIVETAEASIGK